MLDKQQMKFHVFIFEEKKKKIVYIKDINNYFELYDENIMFGEYFMSLEELLKLVKYNAPDDYEKFYAILIARCEIGEDTLDKIEKKPERYVLCIHPSRKCNLSCTYCFAQNGYLPNMKMNIETAKKTIDYFINDFGKNANQYVIDLSGSGEPLLELDFIKEIEEYVDTIRDEIGKDIMLMFCTNGTLIDESNAEYLKKKSRIILGVSIDGGEKENINRIYHNQKETFYDVMKGIKRLAPKKVGLAVTFTSVNENIDEIFSFLADIQNGDCVSIQNVRRFGGGEYSFEEIDLPRVFVGYEKIVDMLLKNIYEDKFEYFEKIIKGSDNFGMYIKKTIYKGKLNLVRCSAGKNRIAADDRGKIYTCSVMNGCKDFCIGDIYEGIDEKSAEKFTKTFEEVEQCKKCWAAYICSGECNANSYYTHGELYRPNEKLCAYRKKMIKLAISFWVKLKATDEQKYVKARNMVYKVGIFTVQDKGVWATFWYLKLAGYKKKYTDVIENLKQGDRGVSPFEIKKYLEKETKEKYLVIKANQNVVLNENEIPAIGCLIKKELLYNDFCVIREWNEKNIKVMFMRQNKEYEIDRKKFLEDCSILILKETNYEK